MAYIMKHSQSQFLLFVCQLAAMMMDFPEEASAKHPPHPDNEHGTSFDQESSTMTNVATLCYAIPTVYLPSIPLESVCEVCNPCNRDIALRRTKSYIFRLYVAVPFMSAPHLAFLTLICTKILILMPCSCILDILCSLLKQTWWVSISLIRLLLSVDISFRSNPCMFYTQGCFHVFLRVLPTPDDEVRNLCSLAMRCLSGKNDLLLDLIMEPRLTTRLADVI